MSLFDEWLDQDDPDPFDGIDRGYWQGIWRRLCMTWFLWCYAVGAFVTLLVLSLVVFGVIYGPIFR